MENTLCGIVIPIYRNKLNNDETSSLKQVSKVLGGYKIYLIHPEGLDLTEYYKINSNLISLPLESKWFSKRDRYAEMMCTSGFYENFKTHKYILIYQLDAWVFKDELEYWCNKGYDYIGAPFLLKHMVETNRMVGNGGFSLRKVESMIRYCNENNDPSLDHFNSDDGFFASNHKGLLNIPNWFEAAKFSLEVGPEIFYNKTKTIPFGCHAFKKYNWFFWKDKIKLDNMDKELKTLICCIGKNENKYVKEYVEWYKHIGVSHIRIYDNNDINGEHFEDVIGDYVENGYVDIVNYRGRKLCQLQSYEECYKELGDKYDWILFIDCGDEYLDFFENDNINDYLNEPFLDNYDMIHINLMTFGDNGNAYYSEGLLRDRFPIPIPHNKPIAYLEYGIPESYHVSSIVRGGLDKVLWRQTPHTPFPCDLKCCNDIGEEVKADQPFAPYSFRKAFFRHYTTKSTEEYCDKMKRGFPDSIVDEARVRDLVETRYFRTNDVTKEKVQIFKEKLGVDMSHLLPYEGEKRNDIKIYSLCYSKKNFNFLNDSVITPLQVGAANGTNVCEVKDNTLDNISDKNYFYIENTGTYWIWKNVTNAKYKGQMQYRRPLDGVNETMDFEDIFSKYKVITCEPFNHPANSQPTEEKPMFIPAMTVEQGYAFSNCIDDLRVIELVINLYYPEYKESYVKYIKNGENLYYSNGFIMKSEDFDSYCEFLFGCLEKYQQFVDVSTPQKLMDRVVYNMEVGKYPKHMRPESRTNDGIRWQMSIGGFLSERLWTLWLLHNFKDEEILKLPYNKMEENMYT